MERAIEEHIRRGLATTELEDTFREWRRWRALNRLRYWRSQTAEEERLWLEIVRMYSVETCCQGE